MAADSQEVDWRGYLVSPGRSVVHGQYTSQLIDPCWGEPTWNPSLARNSRQFLAGMKLLFVIPQKNDNHHLISLLRVGVLGYVRRGRLISETRPVLLARFRCEFT